MKNLLRVLAFTLLVGVSFQSCKKDKKTVTDPVVENPVTVTPSTSTGIMKIRFNNQVDGDSLVLGKTYMNANGETYSISKFNYFISNIVLTKNDNSTISVDLYQIINQSEDTSKTMVLKGIPEGSYKAVKLMLGVDSAHNRSGAQTGGLDVGYAHDMYWNWNQGYISLKLEGKSPASPDGSITYHMGGFSGAYKTQREFIFNFITELAITKNTLPQLNLLVNVNEMFKSPTIISFVNDNITVGPDKTSAKIANNYADMITFGSLKN